MTQTAKKIAMPHLSRRSVVTTSLGALLGVHALRTTGAQESGNWREYRDKYGGRLEYPGNLFSLSESDMGVAVFESQLKADLYCAVDLLDYARDAGELMTLAEGEWVRRGFDVSLRAARPETFVLSGERWNDQRIFYQRLRLSADRRRAHQFVIFYPTNIRSKLDSAVERMSLTFSVI